MKNYNFINISSDKKNTEFIRWFKISAFLISSIIFILVFFYIKSVLRLKELKNNKLNLEKLLLDYDAVMKQKENLKLYQEKINLKIEKMQNLISSLSLDNYLISIALAIPENAYLENLQYDYKSGIILNGYCSSIKCAANFVENLKKLPFVDKIKLDHIKSTDQKKNLTLNNEFLISIILKNKK